MAYLRFKHEFLEENISMVITKTLTLHMRPNNNKDLDSDSAPNRRQPIAETNGYAFMNLWGPIAKGQGVNYMKPGYFTLAATDLKP